MMVKFKSVALLIILISLTGCFEYQEKLVIQSNGSGIISMRYSFDRTFVEQMESMGSMMSPDSTAATSREIKFFDKKKIDSTLAAQNLGIKLLSYDEKKTDSTYFWDMKFSFTDISNLGFLENSLKQGTQEYTEPAVDSIPKIVFAKQADGTWLFERRSEFNDLAGSPESGGFESAADDSGAYSEEAPTPTDSASVQVDSVAAALEEFGEQFAKMMEPLAKISMEFSVTFPGKIVSTNATSRDGNTATWNYSLSNAKQAPATMQALIKIE